jgi:hypothetical protein
VAALFGSQVSDFQAWLASPNSSDTTKAILQVIVSLVLIAAGIYVILVKGYSEATQKIAAGWIGLVAGYWLK